MLPVAVNVPVVGHTVRHWLRFRVAFSPPAISTFPLVSSVAVWRRRAAVMLPVAVNVPVAGLYSSALATGSTLSNPPATSTFPLFNNVAVCSSRALACYPSNINPPEPEPMQVTTTLVTLALATVPLPPAVTPQVCAGWKAAKIRDVISCSAGDGRSEREVRCPCADGRLLPPLSCKTKSAAGKARERAADGVGICGAGDRTPATFALAVPLHCVPRRSAPGWKAAKIP